MAALSLRVSNEFKADIEELSQATGRSVSAIILDWLKRDLELERWQIKRIEAGIKAADDQLFVDDSKIEQALKICRG
ncbi:MAG: hypothetical protein K0R14_33 [Burkholderiales bacterium]|jgi:predicted transcriptional regulator|nr:hypothetical protein [Burkholderiales bacterium]